jgi:alpha-tubulin suppressor-like RCC1 family protein
MKRRELLKSTAAFAGLFETPSKAALSGRWQKVGGATLLPRDLRRSNSAGGPTFGLQEGHSFAIRSDGTALFSGYGTTGAFGDGEFTNHSLFQPSTGAPTNALTGVVSQLGGSTFVVTGSGEVYGCGNNVYGTLGDGTNFDRGGSFVKALDLSNIKMVAAGLNSAAALRADGVVFGSGFNMFGNIGNGSTTHKSSFVRATGISNAIAIAATSVGCIALRSDGLIFASGTNSYGSLGLGATVGARDTFIQAAGISQGIAIAARGYNTVAIRSDGLVFTTGAATFGQVGDGTTTSRFTFGPVVGISNAIAIAAGEGFIHALRSDGLVFGCGYNSAGQVGDGTNVNRSSFVQVLGLSQIVAIGTASALRSDGKLFAVGLNNKGQLGDGTTINRSSFVLISL